MRELARRIKRIAYGWSDKGVTKVAMIILKRFINEKEWEDYWKKKMGIIGNVMIDIGNYQAPAYGSGDSLLTLSFSKSQRR